MPAVAVRVTGRTKAGPRVPFPASKGTVIDRAGIPVDCTGWSWPLNDPGSDDRRIDWEPLAGMRAELLDATAEYAASLIRSRAPSYPATAIRTLVRAMNTTEAFRKDCGPGATAVGIRAFQEMRAAGRSTTPLHHWRMWYRWCAARRFPGFDPDVAEQLGELTIGNDAQGVAVLSNDPEGGPLTDMEMAALAGAIRVADDRGTLSKKESALLWLCLTLGTNPFSLSLLREEDYQRIVDPGTGAVMHQLRVPRIKKRYERHRTAFKPRKLNPEIGYRVSLLVEENRLRRERNGWPDPAYAFPLFTEVGPRPNIAASENRAYAMHMDAAEISGMVRYAVSKLEVVSPRTNRPLRVVPRRLRYTFITRFIREGGSLRAAAEAADHSDTRTVMTYTNLRNDLVAKLDESLALELAPRAQAFMGMLVRNESEAIRGDAGVASRIFHHDPAARAIQPVGTCGSFSFCGLAAPVACYECRRFQPWLDGPHEKVLRSMLARREAMMDEKRDEGQVRTLDRTILAVADVVGRVSKAVGRETAA